MTLKVILSTGGGATTDISGAIRRGMPTGGCRFGLNAEEGSRGDGAVVVDDTAGTLEPQPHRRWWAWESNESAGNQVIGDGSVTDPEVGRQGGEFEDFNRGVERRWTLPLVDRHVILDRRLITGADGDRPEETDIARITWLLGSVYLPNVDNVLGYINTTHAETMDKADLRGQTAYEVLRDCASRSAKAFFIVRRGDTSPPTFGGTDRYSLFYDYDYSATYRTSLIRLTNVLADVDNSTTFAIHPDATLTRKGGRIYSGINGKFPDFEIYQQDTTIGNDFAFRDTSVVNSNIRSRSVAGSYLTDQLASNALAEERVRCRFTVPKTKVNALREGQACECKFSHFTGLTDWTWLRCVSREVTHLTDEFYEISAEFVVSPANASELTSSVGQLMRPYKNAGDDLGYIGAGVYYPIHWQHDGDNPRAGDDANAVPLSGLIQYVGDSGNRTGLQVLGDGLVDLRFGWSGNDIANGDHTFTAYITVQESLVATQAQVSTGGLRLQTWEFDFVQGTELTVSNVAVRNGDIIQARIDTSSLTTLSAMPAGVGNGVAQLRVTGDLLA